VSVGAYIVFLELNILLNCPNHMNSYSQALVALSRQLGSESQALAILGEGNASQKIDEATFTVKASGANLSTISEINLTTCRFASLLPLLDTQSMNDIAVDQALLDARVCTNAKKPSVEAIFHAYLLTLPGVNYVGHTHPVSINSILCSPYARTFAMRRLFPDEVVCCGVESVFVPYTDPGLKLSQAIRVAVQDYIHRLARPPQVILLENHGLIALGATPEAVLAATLMAAKAASIFVGAASISGNQGPVYLSPAQVERIAGRPDEQYRQKILGIKT
jgi:rhamnose utilization protein RhaD (predicted bifunctional aldolase and dehydrogenase)